MTSKDSKQPVFTEERSTPFNCPSCGSMKEIVKIYGNGKQVLECSNCHIDKEKYLRTQINHLNTNTWIDSKPCPECSSKKRYTLIENGKEINRCSNCDLEVL